jgi:hypothetical protein
MLSQSTSIAAPAPVRPPPSIPSSSQTLIYTLRCANARYAHLAAIMRPSRRSTGHARKRAAALGLTIDIENARNLDHKQVSVIPLPVLDIVPSPIFSQQRSHALANKEKELKCNTTRPVLHCSIPQDVVNKEESSALSSVSVYSTVSLSEPEVIVRSLEVVAAPVGHRGWRPVTSRWSMSTADEEEVDVELEEGIIYSSDYEEGMDLPNSAAEEDDDFLEVEKPVVGARADTRLAPRLDVPVDVSRFSWGSALTSDYASSSSSSSSGPATPVSYPPLLLLFFRLF